MYRWYWMSSIEQSSGNDWISRIASSLIALMVSPTSSEFLRTGSGLADGHGLSPRWPKQHRTAIDPDSANRTGPRPGKEVGWFPKKERLAERISKADLA